MKLSIIMAAGAGLAAATPLHVRQTESKRPFVQPADHNDIGKCGDLHDPLVGGNTKDESEACVGTLNYCQKGYYAKFNESFGSAKECVASREPAPPAPLKPFKKPDDSNESCDNTVYKSEACVGTLNYCQNGYYEQFNESFGSAEECVGSRRNPSLKPFFSRAKQYDLSACGSPTLRGNTQRHSEPCVGTVMYCSKGYWAEYKEEYFASEEECLKSRDREFAPPKPAPAPPSVPTPEPTPEPESKPTSISASESASKPACKPTPTPETTLKQS
ncbi:hypothetical protein MY3296_000447 [Beauveria thailandica]